MDQRSFGLPGGFGVGGQFSPSRLYQHLFRNALIRPPTAQGGPGVRPFPGMLSGTAPIGMRPAPIAATPPIGIRPAPFMTAFGGPGMRPAPTTLGG
jgi:hypothetical protein